MNSDRSSHLKHLKTCAVFFCLLFFSWCVFTSENKSSDAVERYWTVTQNLFVRGRKRKKQGRYLAGEWLFGSGLEPGDLAGTIRHCGAWRERDLWQMRVGEWGPPLRKTLHKDPFTGQVPSATCGAREGLRQRPPAQPIGCKISSSPSWTERRKWEIPEKRGKLGMTTLSLSAKFSQKISVVCSFPDCFCLWRQPRKITGKKKQKRLLENSILAFTFLEGKTKKSSPRPSFSFLLTTPESSKAPQLSTNTSSVEQTG